MTSGTCIDVAIVNYNTRERLRECLESLCGQQRVGRVLVADNGSSDGSFDMLRADFPEVIAVSLPQNPGFGAAVNVLFEESDAEFFLVLNADVRLHDGAAGALADALDAYPDAAIAAPRITENDGSLQPSCFDEPTVSGLLWQESGLAGLRRRLAPEGLHTFGHDTPREVPWVLGAAMAIRSTAFAEVGGFDADFFLYFEEVDLCRRLRQRKWTVRFAPEAAVSHVGGASTGQQSVMAQRAYYRSLRRYHRLHQTAAPLALGASVAAIMAARMPRAVVRALRSDEGWSVRAPLELEPLTAPLKDALRSVRGVADTAPASDGRVRTDWIVLLPESDAQQPNVVVLGDASAAELRSIADHFDTTEVANDMPSHRAVDVLVVRPTCTVDLKSAMAGLSDSGILYVETDRRRSPQRANSASRVARHVASQGLSVVGRYWLLPNANEARRLVSLDDHTVLCWYLDNLFIAANPLQRVARALLRRWAFLASAVAPSHAVIATNGQRRAPAVLESVEVSAAGAEPTDPVAVLTSGFDAGSRLIVLPFAPGTGRPRFVMKVAAHAAMNEPTEREHQVLVENTALLPADLVETFPKPMALFTWHGRAVGVESHVSGPTLDAAMRRHPDETSMITSLAEVAAWVTRFHGVTAQSIVWSERDAQHWFGDVFDAYTRQFRPSTVVTSVFAQALEASRGAIGRNVPLVRRHVDLAPWNIIATETGLKVIDWETTEQRAPGKRGLPLCDLAYFEKYWSHIALGDRSDEFAAQMLTFSPGAARGGNTCTAAARQHVLSYCRQLNVPMQLIPALLLYNWVEHAVNNSRRVQALAGSRSMKPPTVAFVELMARHADDLLQLANETSAPGSAR